MMKKLLCIFGILLNTINVSFSQEDENSYYLIGADIEKLPLSEAEKANLVNPVNMMDVESFLQIVFDMLKEPGEGFVPGDTAYFSLWDGENQVERPMYAVIYHESGGPDEGEFVEVLSHTICTQDINLKKGWNIFSLYISPVNKDIKTVMQELIDNKGLLTVQDESGRTLENWGPFGGWVNNIGEINETQGYKISINEDYVLKITGHRIELPITILLNKGWNIISYPKEQIMEAMTLLQPLIDDGVLLKVQDEEGNAIELDGKGNWVNSIGNFVPGKGYQVKVSEATEFVIR